VPLISYYGILNVLFFFQDKRFTCCASIVNFDLSKRWWYPSCPKCNEKLNGSGKKNYIYIEHDVIASLSVPLGVILQAMTQMMQRMIIVPSIT
jgi:hypothetical protein